MSSHHHFIRSPLASEQFFAAHCADSPGRAGTVFQWAASVMNHMERTCDSQPKSHCKPHPALLIPVLFGGGSQHEGEPRKWGVFVQRKVKPKCALQQGSPVRCHVVMCFVAWPCSLKLQEFLPDVDDVPGNEVSHLSLCVCCSLQ